MRVHVIFTDRILDPNRIRCFSISNFCFRITDVVCVSGVIVFDFVSKEKYENKNGFNVYRLFPVVFTQTMSKPMSSMRGSVTISRVVY
jgi:hypothetical protein